MIMFILLSVFYSIVLDLFDNAKIDLFANYSQFILS